MVEGPEKKFKWSKASWVRINILRYFLMHMPFTALNAMRISFAENHFLKISKHKKPIQKKEGGGHYKIYWVINMKLLKY